MISKLDIAAIKGHLKYDGFEFITKYETGSTNDDAKVLAAEGAAEFTVICADHQTKGKGRLGRSFYSPASTGLYFSIILRPDHLPPEDSLYITTAAAAAVAQAVEQICGIRTGIKWVNDIFIDSKKICGILTEASFDLEHNLLAYAVLGIGINIAPPGEGFPEDIRNIANSIYNSADDVPGNLPERLLAEILNIFYEYYAAFPSPVFLDDYRSRSILIGKDVTVHRGEEKWPATVMDIDDRCRLVVSAGGKEHLIESGEVSIRF
ncbi:MAG: biotin--[Clostridia bacterium]|nr:biotin--[acetyl-CoA-carboxylase] ligase [Clostridia bacterium]